MACRVKASKKFLIENMSIMPEKLIPEEFIESYDNNYETSLKVEQDSFWSADPFYGIPWLEGIEGCPIIGSKASFRSIKYVKQISGWSIS